MMEPRNHSYPEHLSNQFTSTPIEVKKKLRKVLVRHEGFRTHPYTDTMGNLTIGIGRNLTDRGLLPTEINFMCDNDIDYFYQKLNDHFSWFSELNDDRKIALISMCFMGFQNFLSFKKMIAALSRRDYFNAAHEIIDSKYARQVGKRAQEIADIIRTGSLGD